MAVRVGTDTFQAEVLEAGVPVLVEFYSDSCKQMSPILGDLEDDYEGRLKVVKVNVNFDGALAETYGVMASPTVLFFKDGEEQSRLRGLQNKAQLEEVVRTLI